MDPASILSHLLPDARHEETHLSHVFITGSDVYKLKKSLKLSFCDFSSVEKRRLACLQEIEVNKALADDLYRDVIALTSDGGEYRLDGTGDPIDWLVHMAPFAAEDRADAALKEDQITDNDLRDFVTRLFLQHKKTPPNRDANWPAKISRLANRLSSDLVGPSPSMCWQESINDWHQLICQKINTCHDLLKNRDKASVLKRCHGDLHLRNLCMWKGVLIAYDALEFDERLTCIDSLYDIAFLIADLWHYGHPQKANLVMNRYLGLSGDYDSVRLMPVYCALRTAIRAMTSVLSGDMREAESYLASSMSFLEPAKTPALYLVSGRSGTGKSTLSAQLAPELAPPPGALHLRSDVLRKRLFDSLPEERLPETAYHEVVSQDVYKGCTDIAQTLKGQWPVILDIAFAGEKAELPPALDALGPVKIWLTAPDDVLQKRLIARENDASDATTNVMRAQRRTPPSDGWQVVDASATPAQILSSIQLAI